MPVREGVTALRRDATLVTIALAIALGWALFQVAEGLGAIVTTLLHEYPSGDGRLIPYYDEPTDLVRW